MGGNEREIAGALESAAGFPPPRGARQAIKRQLIEHERATMLLSLRRLQPPAYLPVDITTALALSTFPLGINGHGHRCSAFPWFGDDFI